MNDHPTTPFHLPPHPVDGDGSGGRGPAAAAGGRAARRRSRRRAGGSRRVAAAAGAAALVLACSAAYTLASSGGPDGTGATAAASVQLAPTPASSASGPAPVSASPSTGSASPSTSPSVSAPASPSASASASKSAKASKAPAAPAKQPAGSAPTGKAAQFAEEVTALTNAERAKAGCGPVALDAKVSAAAMAHSDDMVARHYFEHADPEGRHADSRLRAAGYTPGWWGENIAYGQPDPAAVMDAWMHSEGHRANILNCHFTVIGVGVNFGAGGPWWTQVFASPA
ncbi:CAP domain-containing protein [Streptomyces sp. NRRL B-24484]|uniref:CAP domain-containing protein n=1 Tax=Streptomyces sp. NRRL B-24484 TaxID=1463833 RepID=UPI000693CB17|nr:CAP domain-containing protein [Streptomyces sp. NRRL B-24484]